MASGEIISTAEPAFRDFRPGARGLRLAFSRWELPEGMASQGRVVISHGYGEHGERYRHTAEWLLGLGWRVSAMDHAGFGRSEGARGDALGLAPFVDDLSAFLAEERKLMPENPLVVLGHSFGGLVALLAALRDPRIQDGLILSSPAVILKSRGWPLGTIQRVLGRLAPHLSIEMPNNKSLVCSDEELVRRYWADPLCHRHVTSAFAAALDEGSAEVFRKGRSLACPTLLLQASGDTLVDLPKATAFWDTVDTAILERHLLEGFLHEVFHDRRRAEAQTLAATWLSHHFGGGPQGTIDPVEATHA